MRASHRFAAAVAAAAAVVLLLAGCGGGGGPADAVRIGMLLNITQGPGLIAVESEFTHGLAGLPVEDYLFAQGPDAASALLSGSLDAAYIGPGPYVLAESRAPGRLRLLSGVATGGQAMVARPGTGIRSVADLQGRRVAVPGNGNTQDLTLRLLLDRAGLRAADQGGTVEVVVISNAALAEAMRQGVVDAALASPPFGTRLVAEGLAVPVPSIDAVIASWRIPATVLVATEEFVRANPAATDALVTANAQAVDRARRDPATVARRFNDLLAESTGSRISTDVLLAALTGLQPGTGIDAVGMERIVFAADVAGYLGGPVAPAARVPRPM